MDDLPPELQLALEENRITIEQLRREANGAFRDAVSQQQQERAVTILQQAFSDALQRAGDIGGIVNAALDRLVAGPDAVFNDEDRQEVLSSQECRHGVTPEQTEKIVQSVETRLKGAVAGLRQTVDQIQQQALEVAQTASSIVA